MAEFDRLRSTAVTVKNKQQHTALEMSHLKALNDSSKSAAFDKHADDHNTSLSLHM